MEGIPVQIPLSPQSFIKRNSILLVILALLIILSGILIFVALNQKKTAKIEPTVSLTKDYDNPFDKSTQYVNPFSEYKNPFDSLIQR